jgi:hypothetical protein
MHSNNFYVETCFVDNYWPAMEINQTKIRKWTHIYPPLRFKKLYVRKLHYIMCIFIWRFVETVHIYWYSTRRIISPYMAYNNVASTPLLFLKIRSDFSDTRSSCRYQLYSFGKLIILDHAKNEEAFIKNHEVSIRISLLSSVCFSLSKFRVSRGLGIQVLSLLTCQRYSRYYLASRNCHCIHKHC